VSVGILDQMMVPGATVVVENVTTGRPFTVAVAVFVPTVVPVMNFAAACPLMSVITSVGLTLPPPAVTANAIVNPNTGVFEASVTRTRIESEKLPPATTLVGSNPTLAMTAGGATVTVSEPETVHAVRIKAVRKGDTGPTRMRAFIPIAPKSQ
jgi:hypothetical protein